MQEVPLMTKEEIILKKRAQRKQKQAFERFLQLTELKNHKRLLEKQLKLQQKKERKEFILQRIKIVPPKLKKGIIDYNPEQRHEITARKISCQIPRFHRHSERSELPRVKNLSKIQWSHRWSLLHRIDEINSFQGENSRMTTIGKIERNKTQIKIQKPQRTRIKTDPLEGDERVYIIKKKCSFLI